MEPIVAQTNDPAAIERHRIIRMVQQEFGGTLRDAMDRVENIVKPRLEREQEAAEREKVAAERARRINGQRHYAGQVLAAMLSETDRSVQLGDDRLTQVCREAHRIARRMTELEVEYLGD
jgi:hypothetical protein